MYLVLMKRNVQFIAIALMFLCSLKAVGQVTPKEAVVNEIYRGFVDTTFVYYYLNTNCLALGIDKNGWNSIKEHFANSIPDSSFAQIVARASTDTMRLNWNIPILAHVRGVDTAETSVMLLNQNTGGKLELNKIQKKEMEDQKKNWPAKPKQDKTVYFFSRPVFDAKQQYALINLKWKMTNVTPSGYSIEFKSCVCLLKNVSDHWRLVDKSCVAGK